MPGEGAVEDNIIGGEIGVEKCICGNVPAIIVCGTNRFIRCAKCGIQSGTTGKLAEVAKVWNQMMLWGRDDPGR